MALASHVNQVSSGVWAVSRIGAYAHTGGIFEQSIETSNGSNNAPGKSAADLRI